MSCADFDDIKTICIELCQEIEERDVDTSYDELMNLPKYQISFRTRFYEHYKSPVVSTE